MVYLTRRERFNAAHRLYNVKWSEEKNRAVFGKCANHNFHGHNYDLYVTVKGTPDPDTGFIVNAHWLGKIIKEQIIEPLDHSNLNTDVPFLKDIFPSTENVVIAIWKQLVPHLEGCQLHCIKLVETENIYAEYYGE
ncbi:MAG: 6-carboxytetrahydropterin synthase [Sphingobacteriales bacterium]|nr:6-carboxytetrahydropterin synthase [Sphingobacteriales bacterium]